MRFFVLRLQTEPGTQFEADWLRPPEGSLSLALRGIFAWITVIDSELREKEHASPEPSQRGIMSQEQSQKVVQVVYAGYGQS